LSVTKGNIYHTLDFKESDFFIIFFVEVRSLFLIKFLANHCPVICINKVFDQII